MSQSADFTSCDLSGEMTDAAPAPAPAPAPKRATASNNTVQTGMLHMKSPLPSDDAMQLLDQLAGCVAAEPNNRGFDVLYANIPWTSMSMEDLVSMPVNKLCNPSSDCALFMWVDGNSCGNACDLMAAWGFRFHSILHTMTYSVAENSKVTPHGWSCDGLNVQKSRQLWYATRMTTNENDADVQLQKVVRDASFVRRRMEAASSFKYTRIADYMTLALSSKKKGLERWTLYPDLCAYVPAEFEKTLATVFKPNARVLSLFATNISPMWFCWGPNVPGMMTSPLRGADCFEVSASISRYFTGMKMSTVQRYLGLVNLCAVSIARSLGGDAKDDAFPVLETRLVDFFKDVGRRYTESGGGRISPLNDVAPLSIQNLIDFKEQTPVIQTAILRSIGQIVALVIARAQEAAEKATAERLASKKRKGEETVDENEDGKTVAAPTKRSRASSGRHGIAAPVPISPKLAAFMGLDANENVARTTAVRFVNDYIKQNSLQNTSKRSEIVLDEKLRDLLAPSPDVPVTYFSLSKLLVSHFPKKSAAAAVTAST